MLLQLVGLALLASACMGHAVGKLSCSLPNPPPVISYHIHVVFDASDPVALDQAIALREAARAQFAPLLGEDCDGRYDNGRLCLIYDHRINETLAGGPFPSGEWSMFVPVAYFDSPTLFWFIQHYTTVHTGSLLLHPNTGCEYEDHSIWASWNGLPWPLNMDIFTQGNQSNEFNRFPGDAGNPLCLPANATCGMDGADGPFLGCCHGLACKCGASCVCK